LLRTGEVRLGGFRERQEDGGVPALGVLALARRPSSSRAKARIVSSIRSRVAPSVCSSHQEVLVGKRGERIETAASIRPPRAGATGRCEATAKTASCRSSRSPSVRRSLNQWHCGVCWRAGRSCAPDLAKSG
jgi:hypothetical protein